jgi:hypothetical protein
MSEFLSNRSKPEELSVAELCSLSPAELVPRWGTEFPEVLRCSSEIISAGCDTGYAYGYIEEDPELALEFYKIALRTYDDWSVEPSVGYLEFIRLGNEILGKLKEEKYRNLENIPDGIAYSLAVAGLSNGFAACPEEVPTEGKDCLSYLRRQLCPKNR